MNDTNLSNVRQKRLLRGLRSRFLIVAPAVLLVVAGFVVAYQFVAAAPPNRVVIATGSTAGAYHAFGQRYAEHFGRQGVELALQSSAGSIENLRNLTQSEGASISPFCKVASATPPIIQTCNRWAAFIPSRSGCLCAVPDGRSG